MDGYQDERAVTHFCHDHHAAEPGMAEIHDRMPAILERSDVKTWINGNLNGPERVNHLRSKPCLPEYLKISIHKDHN